ncbi:isochorismatase family cysteine hydrolase [uncultured Parvimonas sp.]|uniref:isochorismatase family cysteine hydrolase n=1 Tax=uncultured Parvimonas sp. TaxID=747372 RepID=UPI002596F692|nr:isochorismatase family cysteine hydrolase [uncultured Parvimonas sp.]
MKALLVLDVQKGIITQKDFSEELKNIEFLINDFKLNKNIVIFTKHLSNYPENPLYRFGYGVEIDENLEKLADFIIEKERCNAFANTNLFKILSENNIEELYICGFNTEYCCLFASIIASDRGFRTILIEDATGTVGDEEVYEMPGLDIKDFVGSILNWSKEVEVLYLDEYKEKRGTGC